MTSLPPRPDPGDLLVRAGGPLSGSVRVGGAKNSVLKLMAACLLAEGAHRIANVPEITDVEIMSELLEAMGCSVRREHGDTLVIETPDEIRPEAPYELVEQMRASVVVLGPLLARAGRARVSLPGGDDFGSRPIDMHVAALEQLGASVTIEHGYVEARVDTAVAGRPRLVGRTLALEYPSHTGTDNVMMAAALAKGTTVIENAAREPEVADLAAMLESMGATVRGAGTSVIEVEGSDALAAGDHRAIPDRVVAATYIAAVGMAGGSVVIEDARPEHMAMLLRKLEEIGMAFEYGPDGLVASRDPGRRLSSVDVATLPYPGVATDYKPFVVTLLTIADAVAIVTENLFFGRFRYVDELRRMGADIRTEGHHAVVRGVERLSGARVRASDIRAGAALVLAGLAASGETRVSDAHHIDRGYDRFAERLAALGADVARVGRAG